MTCECRPNAVQAATDEEMTDEEIAKLERCANQVPDDMKVAITGKEWRSLFARIRQQQDEIAARDARIRKLEDALREVESAGGLTLRDEQHFAAWINSTISIAKAALNEKGEGSDGQ